MERVKEKWVILGLRVWYVHVGEEVEFIGVERDLCRRFVLGPKAKAKELEEVVPGVYNWHVEDERIGARSDAYAVVDRDGAVVLIDPLPIDEKLLRPLGTLTAIVSIGDIVKHRIDELEFERDQLDHYVHQT